MENVKKSNVQLVEESFGIRLPEIQSCEQTKSNGRWYLSELDKYIPTDSMSPQETIETIESCRRFVFHWIDETMSRSLESKALMSLFQSSILAGISNANKNFEEWSQINMNSNGRRYYMIFQEAIFNFADGFSSNKSDMYFYCHFIQKSYLRLLLENSVKLDTTGSAFIVSRPHLHSLLTLLFAETLRKLEGISLKKATHESLRLRANELIKQMTFIVSDIDCAYD